VKKMWGKRYNRGSEHGKRWYIWVSCSAANLFCLCSVPEVSRMCLCWRVWESVGTAAFPALSLKSRQIKLYLPQRITLLCTGILRRVSARGAIYGAFPRKSGQLPQLPPKPSVRGFGGKRTSGRARELFRFAEKRRRRRPRGRGASRAPGCPPSTSPNPKGVFRAAARTHSLQRKEGNYERKSQKKSDPEYPPDTG